jgi:hypothetical protein
MGQFSSRKNEFLVSAALLQVRMTVMLFLKRAAAKAKKTPPIAVTRTNFGHTTSMPAPR